MCVPPPSIKIATISVIQFIPQKYTKETEHISFEIQETFPTPIGRKR